MSTDLPPCPVCGAEVYYDNDDRVFICNEYECFYCATEQVHRFFCAQIAEGKEAIEKLAAAEKRGAEK